MKARTAMALSLSALVLATFVTGPASIASGKSKTLVVGTDPDGDWGTNGPNGDGSLNAFGDAMGQDLVGAEIGMADAKTINFIIKVNSLPPSGGVPEFSRYTWDFNVDGKFTEIDGKFTNYSRGACDPTAGTCPPPRDPGQQPFTVRGNCTVTSAGTNVTTCEEVGLVQATFDPGAGTITVPVPLALIKAKKGSKITAAPNIFTGTISASPAAFLSSSAMPMDVLQVLKTFIVP